MKIDISQIKLANSVKVGRHEEVMFRDKNDLRSHGYKIELVAVKMPVENADGATYTQPLIKITDRMSREYTYTSLMNTISFKTNVGDPAAKKLERKIKAARATI